MAATRERPEAIVLAQPPLGRHDPGTAVGEVLVRHPSPEGMTRSDVEVGPEVRAGPQDREQTDGGEGKLDDARHARAPTGGTPAWKLRSPWSGQAGFALAVSICRSPGERPEPSPSLATGHEQSPHTGHHAAAMPVHLASRRGLAMERVGSPVVEGDDLRRACELVTALANDDVRDAVPRFLVAAVAFAATF